MIKLARVKILQENLKGALDNKYALNNIRVELGFKPMDFTDLDLWAPWKRPEILYKFFVEAEELLSRFEKFYERWGGK